MSIITALLVVYAAPAAKIPVTAEQALAAHRALTSIGPDPCRTGAEGDEIVVCARRESPYALPGYEPPNSGDGLMSGMARETAVGTARDSAAPCHARGEPCVRPLPLLKRKF